MTKGIDYRRLMHRAFRQVMVEVLAQVARDGLPGKHHFFITFDTTHPGVDMPAHLRARYPREMMIVLQEWFEDLAVMKDRFSITLSFGNVPESLVVPFDAVKTFVDPSVEVGFKFEEAELEDSAGAADAEEGAPPATERKAGDGAGEVVSLDKFRKH